MPDGGMRRCRRRLHRRGHLGASATLPLPRRKPDDGIGILHGFGGAWALS
jgi:hypothetical protein